MKPGYSRSSPLILALLLAPACGARAASWGSIRANNHSARQAPAAPRQAPAAPRTEAAAPSRGREVETTRRREPAPEINRDHEGAFQARPERREVNERDRRPEFEHEFRTRRHFDFDEDRRHSYFWFGYNPGMVLGTLPPAYSEVYVSGNPYFYDQGVYFQPGPSGYVVVSPPLGAGVAALPPGAEPIQVGPTTYWYAGGAFYVQQPQGYVVVSPPPGITVSELPPGAQQVVLNGAIYYQADGAYFQPMMQDGVTVYTTVQP